jgi:hypothetical protein
VYLRKLTENSASVSTLDVDDSLDGASCARATLAAGLVSRIAATSAKRQILFTAGV